MKKSPILFISVILLAFGTFNPTKPPYPTHDRILEANLAAALALDNRFIATCGDLTFDLGESSVEAPLLKGLGSHTFKVSSVSEEAQRYFDQGLNLAYGFNHTEAHRSFKYASTLSDNAPMTYWGQAYALGPNINDPFIDDQRKQSAMDNILKAERLITNGSELEKGLIMALKAKVNS